MTAQTTDPEDFDVSRFVVRAGRRGDLSQRELADRAGVPQSTIAAIEAGRREVTVTMFRRLLAVGGLRIAVIDQRGEVVAPVPVRVVRDHAGRRLPAHLDVDPPDRGPGTRLVNVRAERQPPNAWYHLREERDRRRDGGPAPVDHPTVDELEARRRALLYGPRAAAPGAVPQTEECECPTACWLGLACVPECQCQCESELTHPDSARLTMPNEPWTGEAQS